ncbi:MAG: ABC transporter ATP-binding protein [Thermodesulfatator sp.]|nr:MAG: ABC transporter ATP-binding protein [Thermodesulfatator sp.]
MIEAQDISMDYGSVKAVEHCSFNVEKGEIVGLVGPNGAGKTTIMKILSTQLAPTAGTAKINGFDIENNPLKVRQCLGFLPEQAPLYEDMEVREYLWFVGSARGLERDSLGKRLGWVAENCGLSSMWCRPVGELSKGYKQRVGLAQALIHDPPVLILDEPTSGLDPLQIMEIRRLIRQLASEKAILFSTHILQEITALTDRAVVINEGKIRADGPLEELSARVFPMKTVIACFQEKDVTEQDILELSHVKKAVKKVGKSPGQDTSCFEILAEDAESAMREISLFAKGRDLTLLELYQERPDLEQVFSALIYPERSDVQVNTETD